ncbi:peptidoglycan DD-metalloendopeptidase family protein [Metabacillus sp. HB246100]
MIVKMKSVGKLLFILFFSSVVFDTSHAKAESYIEELQDQWVQPVKGTITDYFGTRNGHHKGIDIAAPEGEIIISVAAGTVSKSYYSSTYGHVVFIQHPEGFETVYAHLSERKVNEEDTVSKGQQIGVIGNTGVSTGTHLHFELHEGTWTYEKEHALDPVFVFEDNSMQNENKLHHGTNKMDIQTKKLKPNNELEKSEELHTLDNKSIKTITVSKNDTLWGLAKEHNVPIASLKKWNHLNGSTIYPSQKLIISPTEEESYVVKAGDTLHSIADSFQTSTDKIKSTNELQGETIYPDQVLIIKE